MAYKVIKWRKGRPYLYEQETYREAGKVKTRNRYLGNADNMTKKNDKYDVDDILFDDEHGVLKNKLGILDNEKLGVIENENLLIAYNEASDLYDENHSFNEKDIKQLHKLFLGRIFKWAGTYRNVDISSPGIRYCHAIYIQDNMKAFSKRLSELTPVNESISKQELAKIIAEIHGELIVIHPFRDGNGRTTRLLCDMVLLQAGRNALDTNIFYKKEFIEKYHSAILKVWKQKDYSELETLFFQLLE